MNSTAQNKDITNFKGLRQRVYKSEIKITPDFLMETFKESWIGT